MIEADFKEAMARIGLVSHDAILADGRLHRFRVEGDGPGKRNGWYVIYPDGIPSGAFGCWKRQISETWCMKAEPDMTRVELAEHNRRMDVVRRAREAEEREIRKAARERATMIWGPLPPAPPDHPYPVKKKVKSHGLRLSRGSLVIPLRDSAGMLHSLQFIDAEGNKRFLSGGRKRGCYFSIGQPRGTICICEGYSTGASVHEATGYAVAVAFDAGNLLPVAQEIRAKFPTAQIIICADNDLHTPGNPGLSHARSAALAIDGRLAVPPCAGDFNDFFTGAV